MKYRSGYKYQLAETATYLTRMRPPETISTDYALLNTHGKLTIHKGYAWDGASGPTWDTDATMAPSLVHDALYQLLREGWLDPEDRLAADEELEAMLEERGVWWWRRRLWFRALRGFGSSAADPESVKKVYEVS